MKGCAFSISLGDFGGDFSDVARKAITGAGGHFEGNSESGSFRLSTGIGKVEGSYTVGETTLLVTVTDKPVFISCNRIEKEIRAYLTRI